MCRPSHQVERLGLPKASHQTRNGAAIEGYVGVKRIKALTASDDEFKNELGRKTFSLRSCLGSPGVQRVIPSARGDPSGFQPI